MRSTSARKQNGTRTRTISWQDPMTTAIASAELSGMECLQKMMSGELPPPPIMILMNGKFAKVSEGRVVFVAEPSEYHFNPLGSVHGGFAATLLDTAMACSIHSCLSAGISYATLEIKINYVRPLTDKTGPVHCEGTAVHIGGKIATAEGRIIDRDGNLYAHGTTTCLLMRRH
ncbi:MAG: PaaI family thioesterase [Acidobacteria bacterium]|nr:PaaI family thioesterase [Acidobacteriota bacterium]